MSDPESTQIIDSTLSSNSSTAPKKKANKPKKPAQAPTDLQYHAELLDKLEAAIEPKWSGVRGRHAFAKRDIEVGEVVMTETATAVFPRTGSCSLCLSPKTASAAANWVDCEDCKKVGWCSTDCQGMEHPIHAIECKALQEFDAAVEAANEAVKTEQELQRKNNSVNLGSSEKIDSDVARLAIKILARKAAEEGGAEVCEYGTKTDVFEALFSRRENMETADAKGWGKFWSIMMNFVPSPKDGPPYTVQYLTELASRIVANLHPLPSPQSALGVFPLTLLYAPHSCAPNAHLIVLPENTPQRAISIQALRPIKAGEEITVTFIDQLLQPRDNRRGAILMRRRYWCRCKRCATDIEKSSDRFLTAVRCAECKDGVYIIPPRTIHSIFEDVKAMQAGKDIRAERSYACSDCDSQLTHADWAKFITEADKALNLAQEGLRRGGAGGFVQSKTRLGAWYGKYVLGSGMGLKLHPGHTLALTHAGPTTNAQIATADYSAAIATQKATIETIINYGILQKHNIGDMYFRLSRILAEAQKIEEQRKEKKRATLLKKWKAEVVQAVEDGGIVAELLMYIRQKNEADAERLQRASEEARLVEEAAKLQLGEAKAEEVQGEEDAKIKIARDGEGKTGQEAKEDGEVGGEAEKLNLGNEAAIENQIREEAKVAIAEAE